MLSAAKVKKHTSRRLNLTKISAVILASITPVSQTTAMELEEIIVTAGKRTTLLQDTPISVQVLGESQLNDLDINNFGDYIQYLPTVSYDSTAPGTAQVFMRGIVSGNNGNHSASMPSVAVYLDEQPVTTINEVLDIHAYDINRIEVLSGPQGTLFGSSSQAGALRIIANKPEIDVSESGFDVGFDSVNDGGTGYTVEGFSNIPLSDKAALRLVGWHTKDAGYIDNVARSTTLSASGITINNNHLVEEDFNDVTTSGLRASLKIDLNDNWTVSPTLNYQQREANGVSAHDPEDLGDLNAGVFFDTTFDEDWYQAGLTVEGNVGDLELIYSVSHLNRDRVSQYDYTGYAVYLEEVYAGYGYACYHYAADGSCSNPSQYVSGDENWNRTSHELRLQSNEDERLRFILGLFYQEQEHDFDLRWTVPDLNTANSVIQGGKVVWLTKQIRQDNDSAIFGEVAYDISDKLTALVGVRSYRYDNKLFGFNGFIGHCTGSYVGNVFVEDRANGTPQFPCFDTKILDGQKKNNDNIVKFNLTYELNDDILLYATYSEGYRAGGVNRARVAGIPGYEEDFTENYEFGWKTTLADGRLRFNGALYHNNWKDFQFSTLDFAVSNLTIINNAGNATIDGLEFDANFNVTDKLSLSLAGSYIDAELTEDLLNGGNVDAPAGTELPFTPKLASSAIARYETNIRGYDAHAQIAFTHRGARWDELPVAGRDRLDSYNLVDLAFGISKDDWNLGLFIRNATDERAEISKEDPYGLPSPIDTDTNIVTPRSIGLRFGKKF